MVDNTTSIGPFPALLAAWIQVLVPQPCFDTFFVELDFLHVPCLKAVVSKGLGFAIILGSLIVKVPQIIKVIRARSGAGISLLSITCELVAISASWSYGYASKFPFSSYGEAVFLAFQTIAMAFLVQLYGGGGAVQGALYSVTYVAAMTFLLSPLCPFQLLVYLQGANMFVVMASKLLQMHTNYSNQSTGQLSVITVYMVFLGAVARVFTSIQETGDNLVIIVYVISSVCNGVIAAQMALYWNSDKNKRKTE